MRLGYVAPASLDEALAFLAERGDDSSILAGGMSLVPKVKRGQLACKFLVNIKGIGDLSHPLPQLASDALTIGALVRHREIETSPLVARHFPALRALEETLASVQIRNHGTLVGNLCAAEPWSDPPCLLAALDARLTVMARHGEREVPAADWILCEHETQQQPDELVLRIDIPLPREREGIGFVRLAPRQGLARPLACAAARIALSESGHVGTARVFVGAIGPRPQWMPGVEMMLAGNRLSDELSTHISNVTVHTVDYLVDERCDGSYKKEVAGVLVRRAIAEAIANAKTSEH
jgi:carbon-monoxide dehydrogenase medium subunit